MPGADKPQSAWTDQCRLISQSQAAAPGWPWAGTALAGGQGASQTLRELCQWVRAQHSIEVGTTRMCKTFQCFGLTLKNNLARLRVNGLAFGAWVKQFLVPELRPGDIVVMDNLSVHEISGIQGASE